jgi:predicted kinase
VGISKDVDRHTRECRCGRTGGVAVSGTLVVVCGLPGVGKTAVARTAADALGGEVLRTDVVRKELFEAPEYTDEEERRVYAELISRARERVADGRAVVLDGTFYRRRYRRDAAGAADELDAAFDLLRVDCDQEVVRERIAAREGDESDADFEVHRMYRDLFEAVERDHVAVDNSADLAATRRQVRRHFDLAAPGEGA